MRNGLCVWAKACKCQTLFPRKVPRPATSSFKLATFSRLETLAVYSRTSPARRGNAVSTGAAAFFETAGRRGLAAAALAGFAGGGESRNPAGGGGEASRKGCDPPGRRFEEGPTSQGSTATGAATNA